MIHLKSVSIGKPPAAAEDKFPFNVLSIKTLSEVTFASEITFLVGENGSGKSTFLEAIACAAGSITVGSDSVETDRTLGAMRSLAKTFKLSWSKRTRTGFFLRSEDFFGFAKHINTIRESLQDDLTEIDQEYAGRSAYARNLAKMPFMRELHSLKDSYGEGLDTYSHGESFFTLFQSRFVPGGLYLLDEPEAPLSPMRQIIFMSMLRMMINKNAQFIIATHSPILLAFPGATILSFDNGAVNQVDYERLEHVAITRTFLNNPAQYLGPLFEDADNASH